VWRLALMAHHPPEQSVISRSSVDRDAYGDCCWRICAWRRLSEIVPVATVVPGYAYGDSCSLRRIWRLFFAEMPAAIFVVPERRNMSRVAMFVPLVYDVRSGKVRPM
jgi:hypothetical protein